MGMRLSSFVLFWWAITFTLIQYDVITLIMSEICRDCSSLRTPRQKTRGAMAASSGLFQQFHIVILASCLLFARTIFTLSFVAGNTFAYFAIPSGQDITSLHQPGSSSSWAQNRISLNVLFGLGNIILPQSAWIIGLQTRKHGSFSSSSLCVARLDGCCC